MAKLLNLMIKFIKNFTRIYRLSIFSIFILTVLIGGFFLFNPQKVEATSYQDVIISEIMWSGSNISSSDEWIELFNNSDSNINLTGFQITYLKNNSEDLMLAIDSGIIPKKGYFLISNNAKNYHFSKGESILSIDPDLVDNSLTLSNSNLQLKLYDGSWTNSNLIDIANNGHEPLAGNNESKISMERAYPVGDGDLATSWKNATVSENLDNGSMEIANPHNSGKPVIMPLNSDLKMYLEFDNQKTIEFYFNVSDPDGLADIEQVNLDLSNIGQSSNIKLYDDGTNGDKIANDGIFSLNYSIVLTDMVNQIGLKDIKIIATDKKGLTSLIIQKINIYQLSNNLIINEILPYPSTNPNDEFIELYNRGSIPINLCGWQLDDLANGGSNPYLINNQLIIPSNSFMVFDKVTTGIILNNDKDQVRLIDPSSQEKAVVHYNLVPDSGWSYNFSASGWYWNSSPSKNLINSSQETVNISSINNVNINYIPASQIKNVSVGNNIQLTSNNSITYQSQLKKINIPQLNSSIDQPIFDYGANVNDLKLERWINYTEYAILLAIIFCIIVLSQIVFSRGRKL